MKCIVFWNKKLRKRSQPTGILVGNSLNDLAEKFCNYLENMRSGKNIII
jgi:hypothetical protein